MPALRYLRRWVFTTALLSLSVLFLDPSHTVAADDRTPSQEKAASTFAFEGLALRLSLHDFQRQRPDARLEPDQDQRKKDAAVGVVRYCIQAKAASRACFSFFDGVMYQLNVYYDSAARNAIGGHQALVERFEALFGSPADDSEGTMLEGTSEEYTSLHWHFSSAGGRYVELRGRRSTSTFFVIEQSLYLLQEERRRAKAQLGF